MLKQMGLGHGLKVKVAPSLVLDDSPVSSSRIRHALSEGNIKEVEQMLGKPYLIAGRVISGKALGRTLGFPTLNLEWSPQARPAFGVYTGIVQERRTGVQLPAVANYGIRPTVEQKVEVPLWEIHCLKEPDASIWQVGAHLEMEVSSFLRPEMKFENVDELSAQVRKDCAAAIRLFPQLL